MAPQRPEDLPARWHAYASGVDAGEAAERGRVSGESRDALGRIHPGSQPGWGISWWVYGDAGYTRETWLAASAGERLEAQSQYWDAVRSGWEPPVPREDWTPHHPWAPDGTDSSV